MPSNVLLALLQVAGIFFSAYFTLIGVRLVLRSRGKARVMPVITTLFWLAEFVFIVVCVVRFGL